MKNIVIDGLLQTHSSTYCAKCYQKESLEIGIASLVLRFFNRSLVSVCIESGPGNTPDEARGMKSEIGRLMQRFLAAQSADQACAVNRMWSVDQTLLF